MARARPEDYYARRSTVEEYLAFHFPDGDPLLPLLGPRTPPISERYPKAVRRLWDPRPRGCALDLGCAVGGTTFDLAPDFAWAIGLDRSAPLVREAVGVRGSGRARYRAAVEGEIERECDVAVDARANARFLVGDALALPFRDGAFATVLALNLVDRVPDPARALDEAGRVVAAGGQLIVGSPFTWTEQFTPKARWLGGLRRDGEPARGAAAIRARLAPRFRWEGEVELPFFLPHHARSGQLGSVSVQTFRRMT